MDISLNSNEILSEDIDLGWWDIFFDAVCFAHGCYVFYVLFLINASHISTIEYVINILQHLFIYDLSVAKQESNRFVLKTRK